jgi:imidazoleglycerol-phosphate dehydratase
MRRAELTRETSETRIAVAVNLDGRGAAEIETGIGFFDHMLTAFSRHALIDLKLKAVGDRQVDDHHTVEDCGILIGRAVSRALGDRVGVRRYGACLLPMDEALTRAALDLSGRPFLVWSVPFRVERIGGFDAQLAREFFTAFAMNGGVTLHVEGLAGENGHHVAESAFKAVARALREAVEPDPRGDGFAPSTKGTLTA